MRCSWARGVFLSVLSVSSVASVASAQRPPDRGESLTLAVEPLILRTPREQPHLTIAGTFGALEHGTTLGAGGASAWERGIIDLGYAFRVELPCMRSGTRRWWVTGTVGVSGQLADAGLGDVAAAETAGLNERTIAGQRYDHVALGWHFGASMEVVFDKTLVGFGVDLRDLRGLDTDQARTFLLGANLRVGLDLGL